MSLTLKDVVESRLQQRASGVRRDLSETRDAAQTRRERFSLEDSDRRDDLDSQARVSANRAAAAKAEAAKAESSKTQDKRTQADRPSTANEDRAARPETLARSAAAKPSAPTQPAKPQAGTPPPSQPGAEGSKDAAAEAGASREQGKSDATTGSKPGTEANAATPPIVTVVIAPTASAPPLTASSSKTDESDANEGSDIAVSDGKTKGAGILDLATAATTDAAAAAKPGFEAALAEIAAGASDTSAISSTAATDADPAAAIGATAAPAPTADAKATATVDATARLQAASAPIPLGAVPMTIGLRALGASSRFEIRLDPKDLGRIDVSIDIDKDKGTVGASLVVDRPETLALLQRDASTLQEALSQTGLDASAGISLSLRGGEGEGQRNGRDTGADAQSHGAGQTDRVGPQAGTDHTIIDLGPLRTLRGLGRVDIRI